MEIWKHLFSVKCKHTFHFIQNKNVHFEAWRGKVKEIKGWDLPGFQRWHCFLPSTGMRGVKYIYMTVIWKVTPWLIMWPWHRDRKHRFSQGQRALPQVSLCPQHSRQKESFLPHLMWASTSCKHSCFTWLPALVKAGVLHVLCVCLFFFVLGTAWSRMLNAAASATRLKSFFLHNTLLLFATVII